jgi:hypothetical protein
MGAGRWQTNRWPPLSPTLSELKFIHLAFPLSCIKRHMDRLDYLRRRYNVRFVFGVGAHSYAHGPNNTKRQFFSLLIETADFVQTGSGQL